MSKAESKPMIINEAEITDESLKTISGWQNTQSENYILQSYIDDLSFTQDILTRMHLDGSAGSIYPEFEFNGLIITLMDLKADLMSFRKGGAQ